MYTWERPRKTNPWKRPKPSPSIPSSAKLKQDVGAVVLDFKGEKIIWRCKDKFLVTNCLLGHAETVGQSGLWS